MRVLVCGGRDLTNASLVHEALESLRRAAHIDCIIEGDARGADRIAGYWARKNKIDNIKFRADWSVGRRAGPERNQRMLDEGKPHIVIAFPTEKSVGTFDMIRRAEAAGVPVKIIKESEKAQ